MSAFKVVVVVVLLALSIAVSGCTTQKTEINLSPASVQPAIFEVPGYLTPKSVDSTDIEVPLFASDPVHIKVSPGMHNFRFIYEAVFTTNNRQELKRGPVMEIALDAKPGVVYKVASSLPESREIIAAEPFFADFSAWMVLPDGSKVPAKNLGKGKGLLGDLLSGFEQSTSPQPAAPAQSSTGVSAPVSDGLQQMKALWKTLSDEDRRAFVNSILAP